MGIVTFLTFINEGFVPLTDQNLQNLLIIDIFLLLLFFTLIFTNFRVNKLRYESCPQNNINNYIFFFMSKK